jgi:hypothetical protein
MVRRREGMDMAEKRKSYTREFKLEALRLLETSGKSATRLKRIWGLVAAKSTAGEFNLRRRGRGQGCVPFPATADLGMRSWPSYEEKTRTCARNVISCEKQWPSSHVPRNEVLLHG